MNNTIKHIGRHRLSLFGRKAIGRLVFQNSALESRGWFASMKAEQSIDSNGLPEPWFTYILLKHIKSRLDTSMPLLEYRAGNSTLYYSTICKNVVAAEHDAAWIKLQRNKLNEFDVNSQVIIIVELVMDELGRTDIKDLSFTNHDGNSYMTAVSCSGSKFSIVVVNGLFINSCFMARLDNLADYSVAILDNAHCQAGARNRMSLHA